MIIRKKISFLYKKVDSGGEKDGSKNSFKKNGSEKGSFL